MTGYIVKKVNIISDENSYMDKSEYAKAAIKILKKKFGKENVDSYFSDKSENKPR